MEPSAGALQKMRASATAVSGENSLVRRRQASGHQAKQLAGFVEPANLEIVAAGL
jgi:hypothetical protein